MSYSGFTERLCLKGHYSATDVFCEQPEACRCGLPFRYTHGVDQTNGYDESEPYSCRAPKTQIGSEDEWHMDPYLNRYAKVVPLFAPDGDGIWRRVNSKQQATPPYPDDLAPVAASGTEAGTAETTQIGSVHEGPTVEDGDAQPSGNQSPKGVI